MLQAGTYPGAVEIWQSQNVAVRNSLISQPVWDRGGNTGLSLQGNKTNGAVGDLAVPRVSAAMPDSMNGRPARRPRRT